MNNPVYKWAQVLNRQLTKCIYWQRSTERDVNITLSRNYKVKQWDTTAHLLERLKSKKKKKCWWECEARENIIHCWWEWKTVCHFGRQNLSRSYKTKHTLTYYSAMTLLGIYPKERNTYVHTDAYRIVGKWINKLRSVQTMEFYLVLKSNELQKDVEES